MCVEAPSLQNVANSSASRKPREPRDDILNTTLFSNRPLSALRIQGSEIPPVLLGIPAPSKRPPPEPLLRKEASLAVLGGGENSGNALESSNALNYRAWGIPAVVSMGIAGEALRAFPGPFRNFSRVSSRESQPYWGCGLKGQFHPLIRQHLGLLESHLVKR